MRAESKRPDCKIATRSLVVRTEDLQSSQIAIFEKHEREQQCDRAIY